MDKETYPDKRVVVLSKEMVFTKINGKADTLLARQYNIMGYPTVILANSSGEEIERLVGFYEASEFVTTINDYLSGKNTLSDFKDRLQKEPENIELLYRIGDKHQWRGDRAGAVESYEKILQLDPKNKSGKSDSSSFNVALMLYRDKNYLEAIPKFENLKNRFPESGLVEEADIYIPLCYEKAEKYAQAIEYYQKYLAAHPQGDDRDYAQEHLEKLNKKLSEAQNSNSP